MLNLLKEAASQFSIQYSLEKNAVAFITFYSVSDVAFIYTWWRLYIHGGVYFKIAFGKNNYDKPDLQILCKTERFPVSCFILS